MCNEILIIEDDDHKRRHLGEWLNKTFDCTVSEAKSYHSGLKEVMDKRPTLILLDMQLPTFDIEGDERGGRLRPFAGMHILRRITRLKIESVAVVVTQFESFGEGTDVISIQELRKRLAEEFGPTYADTVYYHPAESDWKHELERILGSLWHA